MQTRDHRCQRTLQRTERDSILPRNRADEVEKNENPAKAYFRKPFN
jgi:hypothetical protein